MNNMQRCLIEGNETSSCIEKTVDCLLSYPRLMWAVGNVHGEHQCNCTNCLASVVGSSCEYNKIVGCGVCMCCSPIYALSSLLAAPFMLLFAPIKMCILCLDNDAFVHNREVEFKLCGDSNKYLDPDRERLAAITRDIKNKQDELDMVLAQLKEIDGCEKMDIVNATNNNFNHTANLQDWANVLTEYIAKLRKKETKLLMKIAEPI